MPRPNKPPLIPAKTSGERPQFESYYRRINVSVPDSARVEIERLQREFRDWASFWLAVESMLMDPFARLQLDWDNGPRAQLNGPPIGSQRWALSAWAHTHDKALSVLYWKWARIGSAWPSGDQPEAPLGEDEYR